MWRGRYAASFVVVGQDVARANKVSGSALCPVVDICHGICPVNLGVELTMADLQMQADIKRFYPLLSRSILSNF